MCDFDDDRPNEPRLLDDNSIDMYGDGSVLKKILRPGTSPNPPTCGYIVQVHYTGENVDGSKVEFDPYEEPYEFELGKGVAPKTIDMCVQTMLKGERALFTVTQKNEEPRCVKIELLGWHSENLSPKGDGGIIRHKITRANTEIGPNDGASVTIHLKGRYKKRVFDDRCLTFYYGEIQDSELIQGIQIGIKYFCQGETSKLEIKPQYAFGEKGHEEFGIPPNATVEYTVTLSHVDRVPNAIPTVEILPLAISVKDRASTYFKDGKYDIAIKTYNRAINYLGHITKKRPEPLEVVDEPHACKVAVYLNIALCQQKQEKYYEARKTIAKVFEIDAKNVKAYYRRGQCYFLSGDITSALQDFQKALTLDPSNKAAQNQIAICKTELWKKEKEDKLMYKEMLANKNKKLQEKNQK